MFEGWFEEGIGVSSTGGETVLCPCGTLYTTKLVRVFDATGAPDLLRSAKNGVLHRVRCPSCKVQIALDAPYCCHNAEQGLFLVVLPETWRHRALEARAGFFQALDAAARVGPVPEYTVNALFVFGQAELLEALGEPARRSTDRQAPRSGRRGVDELVEQVVDEMIEEVVDTTVGGAAREFKEAEEVGAAVEIDDEDVEEVTEVEAAEEIDDPDVVVEVEDVDAVEEVIDCSAMSDDELLALLDDATHRREAAVALVARDAGRFLEPILKTFATLHEPDRDKFLPAVLRLGEPAIPFLLEALEASDDVSSRSAARALSAMRAPDTMEKLREKLASRLSGKGAETYCFALAAFGGEGREAVRAELENTSWVVRAAAVKALARTCGPECREMIEVLTNDRSARVRRAVREALDSLQRFADGGPTGEGPL